MLFDRLYDGILTFIVWFGLIGNSICVIVFFCTRQLRRVCITQYLLALALSDIVFLLTLVPTTLLTSVEHHLAAIPGYCQISPYFIYVCSFSSGWYIAVMSMERCYAVCKPFVSHTRLCVKKSRFTVLAVTVIGLITQIWVMFFQGRIFVNTFETTDSNVSIGRWYCIGKSVADQFPNLSLVALNIGDMVWSMAIPLVCISVPNVMIVCEFRSAAQRRRVSRRQLRRRPGPAGFAEPAELLLEHPSMSAEERRLTMILLSVSSVYMILNLPSYIFRIFTMAESDDLGDNAQMAQHIFYLMFYAQFGTNFLLYSCHALKLLFETTQTNVLFRIRSF